MAIDSVGNPLPLGGSLGAQNQPMSFMDMLAMRLSDPMMRQAVLAAAGQMMQPATGANQQNPLGMIGQGLNTGVQTLNVLRNQQAGLDLERRKLASTEALTREQMQTNRDIAGLRAKTDVETTNIREAGETGRNAARLGSAERIAANRDQITWDLGRAQALVRVLESDRQQAENYTQRQHEVDMQDAQMIHDREMRQQEVASRDDITRLADAIKAQDPTFFDERPELHTLLAYQATAQLGGRLTDPRQVQGQQVLGEIMKGPIGLTLMDSLRDGEDPGAFEARLNQLVAAGVNSLQKVAPASGGVVSDAIQMGQQRVDSQSLYANPQNWQAFVNQYGGLPARFQQTYGHLEGVMQVPTLPE